MNSYSYETEKEQEVYLQDNFLKENFNINDSRYFKLITTPHECNPLEEIWTNEFKDVLSRSSFHYDVDIPEISNYVFSHTIDMHPQGCENIYYSHENALINKEFIYKCDKVYTKDPKIKDNVEGKATEEQLLFVIDRLTYSVSNALKTEVL